MKERKQKRKRAVFSLIVCTVIIPDTSALITIAFSSSIFYIHPASSPSSSAGTDSLITTSLTSGTKSEILKAAS